MEKIVVFIKTHLIAIVVCLVVILLSAGGAYFMVTSSVKQLEAKLAKTTDELKAAKASEESAKLALHKTEDEFLKVKEDAAKVAGELAKVNELNADLGMQLAEAKSNIKKLGAKKPASPREQQVRVVRPPTVSPDERRLQGMQKDIARRESELKAEKERLAEERRILRQQRELREREWAAEQQKAIYQ